MLTRAQAKLLAQQGCLVDVSPSKTGRGTHTRWIYPADPASSIEPVSLFNGSLSTISTGSSLDSYPATPDLVPSPLSTPPFSTSSPISEAPVAQMHDTPSKPRPAALHSASGRGEWQLEDGSGQTRRVLSVQSAEMIALKREQMLEEIMDRELEILLRVRELAGAPMPFDMDVDSDSDFDFDMEQDFGAGAPTTYTDTDSREDMDTVYPLAGPSTQARALTRVDTEIVDPGFSYQAQPLTRTDTEPAFVAGPSRQARPLTRTVAEQFIVAPPSQQFQPLVRTDTEQTIVAGPSKQAQPLTRTDTEFVDPASIFRGASTPYDTGNQNAVQRRAQPLRRESNLYCILYLGGILL
ncbi:hypothetical protein DXG01_003787 [Tephrocybe rancida]|nr:hypothetical protein DXG01_003787 [Tephrocybe rancida]